MENNQDQESTNNTSDPMVDDLPPLMDDDEIDASTTIPPTTSTKPKPQKGTGRGKSAAPVLTDYQLALQLHRESMGSLMDLDLVGMIGGGGDDSEPQEFLTGHYHAFPPSFVDRQDLEAGNKVILPPSVLARIGEISGAPLLFQLRNGALSDEASPITYCGVVEFSSPDDNIIVLPEWMMTKLCVESAGDIVVTRCDELPLGNFVRFQPLSSEFAELPNPKATLEEYLGFHYSTLTEGETIKIKQEDQVFDLKVIECKPASSICIVETSLKVEFDAAVEGPKLVHERLVLGGPSVTGHVEANEAKHYMILLDKTSIEADIMIQCDAISGDPDIYVHQQVRTPSRKENTWSNESKGSKELLLAWGDSRRQSISVFYLSVQGYKTATDYILSAYKVTEEEIKRRKVEPQEKEQGQSLSGLSSTADAAPSPDHKRCTNCLRWIEGKAFDMHDAVCHRQNYRCPVLGCGQVISVRDKASHVHCDVCKQLQDKENPHYHCEICGDVVPVEAKEKHLEVAHSKLDCECGASLDRESFMLHKEFECPKRKVECKYCARPVPFDQYIYHKDTCGATTMPCEICGKLIVLKRIEIHYAAEHKTMYRGKGSAPIEEICGDERTRAIENTKTLDASFFAPSASTPPPKPSPATRAPASKPRGTPSKLTESGYACPNCGYMCKSTNELQNHMLIDCIVTKEYMS